MPPNLTDRPEHTEHTEHTEHDLAERADLTGRVPPREPPKQLWHTPLAFPVDRRPASARWMRDLALGMP